MAKNDKPKSNKGIRNDDRKNGKAWKKNPKSNPPSDLLTGLRWVAAQGKRREARKHLHQAHQRKLVTKKLEESSASSPSK